MNRILHFSLAAYIAWFSGCDIPDSAIVIDSQIPPVIVESSIAPTTFDFGKVISAGSSVDVSVIGYVFTKDDNGLNDIATVKYSVYTPNGSLFSSGTLTDNGIFPDANSGDGKYSSTIPLSLPKTVIGIYNIQFTSVDRQGFRSNTFNLPLSISLSTNRPPSISNLSAPDSVRVPITADSVNLVFMKLTVSDPDGPSDITSVFLTSQRPDTTVAGTFFMFDDGSKTVHAQFGLTSGDDISGDGVYSIIVPIFNSTQRNTYRDFIFTARDQSGAFSNVITKRVFIR